MVAGPIPRRVRAGRVSAARAFAPSSREDRDPRGQWSPDQGASMIPGWSWRRERSLPARGCARAGRETTCFPTGPAVRWSPPPPLVTRPIPNSTREREHQLMFYGQFPTARCPPAHAEGLGMLTVPADLARSALDAAPDAMPRLPRSASSSCQQTLYRGGAPEPAAGVDDR